MLICPDEIRPDAEEMVRRMHLSNFDVVMLTGDHKEVAEEVTHQILRPFISTNRSVLLCRFH